MYLFFDHSFCGVKYQQISVLKGQPRVLQALLSVCEQSTQYFSVTKTGYLTIRSIIFVFYIWHFYGNFRLVMAKRSEYWCCKFAAYSVPHKISRRLEVFRSFFLQSFKKFCSVLYLLEISPRFRLRIWFIRQITAAKSWRPLGCQIHKALRSRNLGKNKCCAGMFDLQKKNKTFEKRQLFSVYIRV